jgi:hypothetical protein
MKTWSSWEIVRNKVSICGRVVDDHGGMVSGVRVNIVSMPDVFRTRVSAVASAAGNKWDDLDERPDRTVTRLDGIFYFLDLPAGPYSLSFDTRSANPQDEKKEAVIWDILPAVRDTTKGNVITPYMLMPHVTFKIPCDKPVKYEFKGQ